MPVQAVVVSVAADTGDVTGAGGRGDGRRPVDPDDDMARSIGWSSRHSSQMQQVAIGVPVR